MEFKPRALRAQRLFLATVIILSNPMVAAAAPNDLPIYPAAKTQPIPANVRSMVSRCGHTFTMEKSMTVDADPHAIAKWYQSRLPGSRTIDLTRALNGEEGGSNQTTTVQVFAEDGSQTVVVSRTKFDRVFANASKSISGCAKSWPKHRRPWLATWRLSRRSRTCWARSNPKLPASKSSTRTV